MRGNALRLLLLLLLLLTANVFIPGGSVLQRKTGQYNTLQYNTGGTDKSLVQPGRKQATATEDFDVHTSYFNHNWRNISTIYIYITRLSSNEIFSPSNKIHREVGRAKDLSASRYNTIQYNKIQ